MGLPYHVKTQSTDFLSHSKANMERVVEERSYKYYDLLISYRNKNVVAMHITSLVVMNILTILFFFPLLF